ncbi:MAG: response regulator transcription factor, partial [Aquihabitans sp.]
MSTPPAARILVVDDERAILRALSAALEARGYRADLAMDGQSAVAQAASAAPDLVILDLGLPDIDGVEVCRRMRGWSRSPIIVVTADGSEDRKILALDEGADDYVTKPFSMPELLARLRVALRHRRALGPVVDDTRLEV